MNLIYKWLGDIRFWILLTVGHRLMSILQPPLEMAHNWRQATVCMVARNFLEIDPNIFYPRVDMAGDLSGITGMEFPFLNYLIYLVSLVFGYDHWYGRLINLLVSSAGIYYFYRLLREKWNKRLAFYTAFLLLFSMFYYYSRKIMPDTFSIALITMGIYAWHRFTRTRRWWTFVVGLLLVALGLLCKLPSGLMLAFLIPVWLDARKGDRIRMAFATMLAGALAGWWYFLWVPYLEEAFGFHHFFMGKSMGWTAKFLAENWLDTLHLFYQEAMGFSGFVLFLLGLMTWPVMGKKMRLTLLVSLVLLVGLMLKSGEKFTNHGYYVLPFIPIMALVGANILQRIRWTWALVLAMTIVLAEGVFVRWEDQFIKKGGEIARLDEILAPHMPADALVAINSGKYPTPLYFAHRKGWLATNKQLLDVSFVNELRAKSCSHVIVLKQRFGNEVELPYPMLMEDEIIRIYELP